ncbi:LysR family transcriptional regulator [Sinorhizobium fredii]|uniref:LysR family transcriptional regulator n=1 Tax=Rhizobium fredii TaxID=380 RepID=UPI001F0AC9FC|nr:LysR family transcriptional regulator [Sinorhizobium fredii]
MGQLGTFERAASKLNTTQSAVSKRIQELELVTRVPLFDRGQRNARMTEKGEQLLILAEEMLALQQRVVTLSQRDEMPVRQLRLGITELTALTWLPRFITDLRASYPKLAIETEVDMSRNLYDDAASAVMVM